MVGLLVSFGFWQRVTFTLYLYACSYIFRKNKICCHIFQLSRAQAYLIKQSSGHLFCLCTRFSSMKNLLFSNSVLGALLVKLVGAKQQMCLRTILFNQFFCKRTLLQGCFHPIFRASLFGLCLLDNYAYCWQQEVLVVQTKDSTEKLSPPKLFFFIGNQ